MNRRVWQRPALLTETMTESSTASSYTFRPLSDKGEPALPAVTSNGVAENYVEAATDIFTVGYDEDGDAHTEQVHMFSVELPAGGVAVLPDRPAEGNTGELASHSTGATGALCAGTPATGEDPSHGNIRAP